MRPQIVTTGIVLARTDFQEADRILTMLTPDHGKLRVIAKGVRRQRSKLAGGIELFSVSHVSVLPGRGELGTLISARLDTYYGQIVNDIQRTMQGYEFLRRLHKLTEDAVEPEYYHLLVIILDALNTPIVSLEVIQLWFDAQLLGLTGHQPNLQTDITGQKLSTGQQYVFDFDNMCFSSSPQGTIAPEHIKFLRLAFASPRPALLQQVTGLANILPAASQLVGSLHRQIA
jgi:DNA repair protein RecO (recombination protein O)